MKRLLLSFVLILLPSAAAAAELHDRDVLLTEDGILYTVQVVRGDDFKDGRRASYLTMTIHDGDRRVTAPVPGALSGGEHTNPALAYDPDSKTLFLFWQETLYRLSSRLLFASFKQGEWSDVTALDSVDWKLRRNLRIAVTRTIEANDERGRVPLPQVVVHAVWWEETGDGEWARYAMLGIDNGAVTSTDFRYLLQLSGTDVDPTKQRMEPSTNEVLRHPAVFANGTRDAVEVIFGDAATNTLHRLRIKPALDGRVRIPIGVRGPALRTVSLNVSSEARVSAVIDGESVALYTAGDKTLDYVVFRQGRWSAQRSIGLNEDVSAQTAADALRRMVAAQ